MDPTGRGRGGTDPGNFGDGLPVSRPTPSLSLFLAPLSPPRRGRGPDDPAAAPYRRATPRRPQVIYHLNNRNEDHEFDLSDLSEQYESEIEQILRDAAEKMNTFRAQIELSKEQGLAANAVARLKEEHEAARRQALADYEQLKKEYADREAKIKLEADGQVYELTQEVLDIKHKFQQQLVQFTETVRGMEGASQSADLKSLEVQELTQKLQAARKEVTAVVQKGNQRYNEMLAERMAKEDDLLARLQAAGREGEARAEEARRAREEVAELRERLEELGSASQTERAALERRTQDELHVLTKQLKELQDGTSALRATLKAQEGDITSKAKALYDLQVQNNDVVRENFDLKERLKHLEEAHSAVSAAAEGRRGECDALRAERDGLQQRAQDLEARVKGLALDAEAAKALEAVAHTKVEEAQAALDLATDRCAALEAASREEKGKWEKAKALAMVGLQADKQKLLDRSRELERELQATAARLAEAEAARAALQAQHEQSARALRDAQQAGAAELAASRSKDADLLRKEREAAANAREAHRQEVAGFKKQIKQLADDLAQAKLSATSDVRTAGQKAKQDLEKKLEEARQDYLKRLRDAERDYKQQMEEQRKAAANKLANREESLRKQMAEMKRTMDQERTIEVKGLENQLTKSSEQAQAQKNELKVQLAELMQQLGAEKALRQKEVDAKAKLVLELEHRGKTSEALRLQLEDKLRAAVDKEKQLAAQALALREAEEAAKLEMEAAVTRTTALQKQVEDLRAEQVAAAQRAEEVLAESLAYKDEEWQRTADEMVAAARAEAEEAAAAAALALRHQLESEKEAEKAEVAAEWRTRFDAEVQRGEEALQAARDAHQQELQGELLRHRTAAAEAAAAARAAKDRLEDQLLKDSAKALSEAKAAHDAALGEARASHEAEVAALREGHAEALAGAEAERVAERDRLVEEHGAQAEALRAAHAEEVAGLTGQHEARVTELVTKNVGLEKGLAGVRGELDGLAAEHKESLRELGETHQALSAKQEELVTTTRKMTDYHTNVLAETNQAHAEEVAELEAKQAQALEAAAEELRQAQEAADEKYGELSTTFVDLKARFDARESREEDLAKIAELEENLLTSAQEVEATHGKMRTMKADLNNREQNFNNTFANGGERLNVAQKDQMLSWMLKSKQKDKKKGGPPRRSSMVI